MADLRGGTAPDASAEIQSLRAALAKSEEARETAERERSEMHRRAQAAEGALMAREFMNGTGAYVFAEVWRRRAETAEASLSQALARIEELEKANRLMRQPFIEQRMKPGVRWVIAHLHDRASRMNHYPCKQWLNSLGYELGNRINDNRIDIAAAFESAATPIDGGGQ
jgi:hypothetical protein